MRAAANLFAARHDQQAGRARRVVERRGKHRAFAIEVQLMPHVLLHAAMSAAIAAAIAASSLGSARSQSGVPAMPSAPRPMLRRDRKGVGSGKSGSGRVDLGGGRTMKRKTYK